MKRLIIVLLTVSSLVYAKENLDKKAEIQIFTNPEVIRETMEQLHEIDQLKREVKDIRVAVYPLIENIKTVKKLYLHPSFITTLNIDTGYEIVYAKSSFATKLFDRIDNTIQIQPTAGLKKGSIAILIKNKKTGERYLMNILVERYSPYIKTARREQPLYLVVNLTDRKLLSPLQVIEAYYRKYKAYPPDNAVIYINGIAYKIRENATYGNVRIGKKSYLITALKIEN